MCSTQLPINLLLNELHLNLPTVLTFDDLFLKLLIFQFSGGKLPDPEE